MTEAAPDGRTLLLGSDRTDRLPAVTDEAAWAATGPGSLVAIMPLPVLVPSSAQYASLRDLVKTARSAPRGISVGSPGRFTPGDLAIELFRIRTGARLATVPFDGGGPALDAVANGIVGLYF